MKVFYISSGLQGCYSVRCLLPLQANGWDGDKTSLSDAGLNPEQKALAAKNAQVIVFHRPDEKGKLELARLLKKAGKKIVFDNDDTFKDDGGFKFNEYMDKKRLEKGLEKINDTIDNFIKEADLITCSTEFLKKEYEKINPNVVVLPNCIDPFYFDEPLRNETDIIRIGITGSLAITSDLDEVKKIIEHYREDKRIKFVVFSMPPHREDELMKQLYHDEYAFWDSVDIEWQPFVPMEDYYNTLNELKLDIMIIPRADTYFNRCKSNLKFLEASMFEIPVIAQSFETGDSPYEQNPEDSKYLLLAKNTEEFIEKIELLTNNKELRLEIGKKAKEYVSEAYNIANHADKWAKAYGNINK